MQFTSSLQSFARRFLNVLFVIMTPLIMWMLLMVAADAHAQAPQNEPQWSTYLVKVTYLALQDPSAQDMARLEQLQTAAEQAKSPSERRAAEQALERARKDIDAGRGAIIYGWTLRADDQGKPVDTARTMRVYFLPNDSANRQTLIKLKPDSLVAIDRNESRELFTFAGRGHVLAQRCALVSDNITFGPTGTFAAPPDEPLNEQLAKAITAKLSYNRSEARDNGGTLYRYSLAIKVDNLPPSYANRGQIELWLNSRVRLADGQTIGPVLEHIKLTRSEKGNYGMTRSFEFITRPGITLDPRTAEIELIAAR